MKTLSKVLCLLMVAVMCMSFFGASASALSFNIGGSGSSGSGISFPIGAIDDDEGEVASTPAPKSTPALDAGFGVDDPKKTEDPASSESDAFVVDASKTAADLAAALKDGVTAFRFEAEIDIDEEIVIENNVSFVFAQPYAGTTSSSNIKVKGALRVSGSGFMAEGLPVVEDGGKLILSGCNFDVDPSAYCAEGCEAKFVADDGVWYVSKKTATTEEPKAENETEDEEIAVYRDIDDASKKVIILTPNGYYKGSGVQVTAEYNSSASQAGNLEFFFLVSTSADTVNSEDVLTPDVDYYVDHAADGASTVYLKNSFLDKLSEGFYWFGGGKFSGSKVDLESVRYSTTTLHIANQDVPAIGDGTGGILVSVFDKKYTANGGWEAGDGALHFYCKRTISNDALLARNRRYGSQGYLPTR